MSTSRESCLMEFDRRDRIPLEIGSMSTITMVYVKLCFEFWTVTQFISDVIIHQI